MQHSYVYILSNKNRTTLYIGVTSDLKLRIQQHQQKVGSEFTTKYNVTDLVYYEEYSDINQAIQREKQLKNWRREWKLNLIKELNPDMITLEY